MHGEGMGAGGHGATSVTNDLLEWTKNRDAALRTRMARIQQAMADAQRDPFFLEMDEKNPGAAVYVGGKEALALASAEGSMTFGS